MVSPRLTPEGFLLGKLVGIVVYILGGVTLAALLSHYGAALLTPPARLLAEGIYGVRYGPGRIFSQDTVTGVSIGLLYATSVSGMYKIGRASSQYYGLEGRSRDALGGVLEYLAVSLSPVVVGVIFLGVGIAYLFGFGEFRTTPTTVLVSWGALFSPPAVVIGVTSASLGFVLDRLRARYLDPSVDDIDLG